jgi:hypothetical protein
MAGWRELVLSSLAFCVSASTVTAGESLPADRAENASAAGARSGFVAPTEGVAVTLVAIEAAVRADAARAWQRADPEALQIGVEDVTWSDGALGCPRPGMAYTQALVPGWRLVVRDDGREAIYHASRRGQWLFCPVGRSRGPLPGATTR